MVDKIGTVTKPDMDTPRVDVENMEEDAGQWVDRVLNDPNSPADEKQKALDFIEKAKNDMADAMIEYMELHDIEDDDEREAALAKWEAENE